MTILFVGNNGNDIAGLANGTGTTAREAAYNPDQAEGLANSAEINGFTIPLPTAAADFWLHMRMRVPAMSSSSSDGIFCSFYDNAGNRIAYVDINDGSLFLVADNGTLSTLVPIGYTNRTTYTYDVHIRVDGSGILAEWYTNGALAASATRPTAGTRTGVRTVRFDMDDVVGVTGSPYAVSEVICTDGEATIGWRLATLTPNANGTHGDWLGGFSDIQNLNDGSSIKASVAGLRESFTTTAYGGNASPAGVRAVIVGAFAQKGPTGPQHLAAFARIGGVNYDLPAVTPPGGKINFEFAVNPATGLPWATADLATTEFGFLSVT